MVENGASKSGVESAIVKPDKRELTDKVALGIFGGTLFVALILGIVGAASAKSTRGLQELQLGCQGVPEDQWDRIIDAANQASSDATVDITNLNGFDMLDQQPGVAVGSVFIAFALAMLWLFLLRTYTRVMVWGTLGMSLVVLAIAAVYGFAIGATGIAAVFLAILALEVILLFFLRKSIMLCADLLCLACQALMHYPSILGSHALIGLTTVTSVVVAFIFMVLTQLNVVEYVAPLCIEPVVAGHARPIQIFVSLALAWWLGYLAATRLFVSAFVAGQWYFHKEGDRVENPSFVALQLAVTKSMGSLAIAGAITAIVNYLKERVRKMRRSCNPVMICLGYLMAWLLSFVEFLTGFATVMVGVTGESFMSVAMKSGKILKGSFVDGFATDRYSKLVLKIGAIALSLLIGIITWAIADSAFESDSINSTLLMIVFTLLVLMGPMGLVIGIILALFLTGDGALMGLAVVFAGASQMILLFLAATLIDTTTAVFAFYAVDKANATVTGEHGAELHAVVGKYGETTGQTTGPSSGGAPTAHAQGAQITVNPAQGVPGGEKTTV